VESIPSIGNTPLRSTPDGDAIVFASNRPSGQGSDLDASWMRAAEPWKVCSSLESAAGEQRGDEYHAMLRGGQIASIS
jgi:hypothetical protein